MTPVTAGTPLIEYPDSDGKPMADNTLQFEWIATIKGNLDLLFANDPDVFVAGDNLIYPVEGSPAICQAPDVYVAFGRPKGERGSYQVWMESDIFPQIVFEVWSPSNRPEQMKKKFEFYELYGAQEYYIVHPETPAHVEIWRREGNRLAAVADVANWVSPRTGLRFEVRRGELFVFDSNGKELGTPIETARERDRAFDLLRNASAARDEAVQKRDQAVQKRDQAIEQAAKLAAKLRELGIDPDSI